jgi:hypothetical protein
MQINDLEYWEMDESLYPLTGGNRLLRPLGIAMADFGFNSLVVGSLGSFAGGDTQILTTATPQGFNTGFSFIYQAVATGFFIPEA